MLRKMWEVTVEHAKTCVLTDKVHYYYPNNLNKTGIVFNAVGEVRGLISDKFVLVDDLSETEKVIMFSFKTFIFFPSRSLILTRSYGFTCLLLSVRSPWSCEASI
jgi:hypothetical protein